MGADERADATRIHERETAQINDDVLACIQARGQRGLELPDRGQVKLTGQVEQRALFLLRRYPTTVSA